MVEYTQGGVTYKKTRVSRNLNKKTKKKHSTAQSLLWKPIHFWDRNDGIGKVFSSCSRYFLFFWQRWVSTVRGGAKATQTTSKRDGRGEGGAHEKSKYQTHRGHKSSPTPDAPVQTNAKPSSPEAPLCARVRSPGSSRSTFKVIETLFMLVCCL